MRIEPCRAIPAACPISPGAPTWSPARTPVSAFSARAARARRCPRLHDGPPSEPAGGRACRVAAAGSGCFSRRGRDPLLDTSNLGSVRSAAASVRGRGGSTACCSTRGSCTRRRSARPPPTGTRSSSPRMCSAISRSPGELLHVARAPRYGRMVWVGSMSTSISPYDPVDPAADERLLGLAGLRAVEGRHYGARVRGRPSAARRRVAGGERRRAPRLLDERPHRRHRGRERAVEGERFAANLQARSPSRRSTAPGRSCALWSIPTSRAASSGSALGRPRGSAPPDGVEDHPRRRRRRAHLGCRRSRHRGALAVRSRAVAARLPGQCPSGEATGGAVWPV